MVQAAPEWTRDTPWRQGHALSSEAAAAFGLAHHSHPGDTLVMVISHDCDIANDNFDVEPDVEIIVGRLIPKPEGNFSWGKAPKTLHLEVACDDEQAFVELQGRRKLTLPKSALAAWAPREDFALEATGLAVLRSWLASRYKRAAFPDAFNRRLEKTDFDRRLAKILAAHGELISFVYFDLAELSQQELPDGMPYELTIVLVYPPGDEPLDTVDAVDAVVEKVEKVAQQRLSGKDGRPSELVQLKACFTLSEQDITISQARHLMQWRLEHVTLKSEDDEPAPVSI